MALTIIEQVQRWKRAVVDIELVFSEATMAQQETYRLLEQKMLFEMGKRIPSISVDASVTHSGTAIFFELNGRHGFLTARHVLVNHREEAQAEQDLEERLRLFPELDREVERQNIFRSLGNQRVPKIFRRHRLDDISEGGQPAGQRFLMLPSIYLGDPSLDLGIVGVPVGLQGQHFIRQLLSEGYEPITIDDIGEGNLLEGSEIFTIGFPRASYMLELDSGNKTWESSGVSEPLASFGHVGLSHPLLPFFWADMSVYPGNSGGPIIFENKLAGIVSANAVIETEGDDPRGMRIPFAKIVKAQYFEGLLEKFRNDYWHLVRLPGADGPKNEGTASTDSE